MQIASLSPAHVLPAAPVMLRIGTALLSITFAIGCVSEAPDDDATTLEEDLTGSGSAGTGSAQVCRYKNWSVPWSCTYFCLSTEIGGGGGSETHSGTLSGTASCTGGSCAAAASAAEASFSCPASYPVFSGGIWTATCKLSSGPNFGGVSCTAVY